MKEALCITLAALLGIGFIVGLNIALRVYIFREMERMEGNAMALAEAVKKVLSEAK